MDLQDSVQRSLQNPAEKSCRSAQIRKDRKPGDSYNASMSILFWSDYLQQNCSKPRLVSFTQFKLCLELLLYCDPEVIRLSGELTVLYFVDYVIFMSSGLSTSGKLSCSIKTFVDYVIFMSSGLSTSGKFSCGMKTFVVYVIFMSSGLSTSGKFSCGITTFVDSVIFTSSGLSTSGNFSCGIKTFVD